MLRHRKRIAMPSAISPVLLSLALVATCTGAEIADLRFGLGVGPLPEDHDGRFDPNDGSTPVATGDDFAGGTSVSGVVSGTFGSFDSYGLLFGIDLRHAGGTMSMDGSDGFSLAGRGAPSSTYTESGIAGHAGLGLTTGGSSHLEVLGLMGTSWITLDVPANLNGNVDEEDARGSGFIYGARVGWYHTLASNWQLGVCAEWTRTTADGRFEASLETTGLGARVGFGYRF
jgi:hypothetical protein